MAKVEPIIDLRNDYATVAMSAMLKGIYSHPGLATIFDKVAGENSRTVEQEIVYRAWVIAELMVNHEKIK